MNKKVVDMLDKVVRTFGLEDERTIYFTTLCELYERNWYVSMTKLEIEFEEIMKESVSEEE
jgi:hypothetical protein